MRKKEEKKTIRPWTIYLWQNGDKMEGASPVVTKDGLKDIYCYGWEIEKDYLAKRNEEKHQVWRAKVQVKNLLNNTLNVLNWYGKKVLDDKGNIDPEKFKHLEAAAAFQAYKHGVDIDEIYKIQRFPIKTITLKQANEYGFKRTTNQHYTNEKIQS